jgi:hypothetical protein
MRWELRFFKIVVNVKGFSGGADDEMGGKGAIPSRPGDETVR